MAEKKFYGAPFGTQTARFDVTGVHPKTKIPGTFTQIPYDKPSTEELTREGTTQNRIFSSSLLALDCHLRTTKELLTLARKGIAEIKAIKLRDACPQIVKCGGKQDHHVALTEAHKFTSPELIQKTNYEVRSICGRERKHVHGLKKEILGGHSLASMNISSNKLMVQQNPTPPLSRSSPELEQAEPERAEEQHHPDVELEIGDTEHPVEIKYVTSTEGGDKEINTIEYVSPVSQEMSEQNSVKTEQMLGFELRLSKSVSTEHIKSKHLSASLLQVINLHTSTSDVTCPDGRKKSTRLSNSEQTPIKGINTGTSKAKGRNSFSTKRRSGQSSKLSSPDTLQRKKQSENAEDCETFLRRKLGPGAYNTIVGGFSNKSVEGRASGPGWARQLEVERLASLPHLLYKEQWEENRMLKRKLGPGSYEIKDFIQRANEKPRSGRGICDNLAPRFEKGLTSGTPGPGTYGIGGVPQRALEEKAFQSTSTKGMLDKGDRKRNLPSVGSHLGPGTYRHKTCTDELLNKVTSLKGPYKLFSGDRNKPISEGYLAAPQLADLGPGQYEIGSFVDNLNSKEQRIHGKFGKMAQYPEVPTERLFLFSNAHCPKKQFVPGPGAYSVQELSKPAAVGSPGFLSSAKRDDKMSQKFFTRNFNPVGAGRYDVQKFEEAQDVNGHSSVFKSKTGKPNLQMAKFLQERIRSKDVSVENRVVLNQPCKLTRSITVM